MKLNPRPMTIARTNGFQHYPKYGDEFEIGFKGEKVFKEFLEKKRIQFIYSKNKIADFDFKINGYTIDVKTVTSNPFKKRLLIPQFQGVKCDYYIGIKLPMTICGYLTKEEVKCLPIDDFGHCNARWIFLNELKDIKEFLKEVIKKHE